MITENSIIAASKDIESADLDGEAILLDINSGMYYGLSKVGARIMELLEDRTSVTSLFETLLREYDVESSKLENDIIHFLQEMDERGLIQVLNGEVA